jgi:hypothetical protein
MAPVAQVVVGELPDVGEPGEHVVVEQEVVGAIGRDAGQRQRALGIAAGEGVEVHPDEVPGAEDGGVQADDRSSSGDDGEHECDDPGQHTSHTVNRN